MTVRVLLVDDVEEVRAVIRQALRLRGGFEVVGEAADAATAAECAAALRPDVVVLDLGLPDLAGSEVVARVRAADPAARIVVYTGSINADRVSIAAEVDAFVPKEMDVSYLVGLLGDLERRRLLSAELPLGPALDDVAVARRFLADHCRQWGCEGIVDDALLVASELVTNALVHAGTTCELRVRFAEGILRLEVTDSGSGSPDLQVAGDEAESGRGILLVSAICQAWAVEALESGAKVVWAELAVPPDPPTGSGSGTGTSTSASSRPSGPLPGSTGPGRGGVAGRGGRRLVARIGGGARNSGR